MLHRIKHVKLRLPKSSAAPAGQPCCHCTLCSSRRAATLPMRPSQQLKSTTAVITCITATSPDSNRGYLPHSPRLRAPSLRSSIVSTPLATFFGLHSRGRLYVHGVTSPDRATASVVLYVREAEFYTSDLQDWEGV